MTVAGHFEEYGIVIEVWKPEITVSGSNVNYEPEGELVGTIQDKASAYSHVLGAFGGYLSASVSITDREEEIDDWFTDGLGRHINVFNKAGDKIWEGFVDSINGAIGDLIFVRGPLQDIANRVSVIYQLINRTVNPPITGMRAITAIAENSASHLTWGIFEKIFNGPGMSATEAQQVRDKFLLERKDPETDKTLSTEGGMPNVTLALLGYIHFLKAGIYNQTTNSGTTTLSVKIGDILDDGGADPNTLFSSANADIEANAILVQRYENSNNVPLNLIKALVAQGEPVNDYRTLFGVFEGRKVVYETMPQTIEYIRRLKGQRQDVMTEAEEIIYPWDVKAGKWLQIVDFMMGESDQKDDLRLDPRMMFLEQVNYAAPWRLSLQGGKTTTFPQRIAQLGMGGGISMSSGTVQQRNPALVEPLNVEYVRNTGELHLSHEDVAAGKTAAKYSVILVTTGAGNVTITLPVAADSDGKVYAIKKVDAGAGNVIVDGDGGETIDGALTQTLAAQWDVIMIVCDGVAWYII